MIFCSWLQTLQIVTSCVKNAFRVRTSRRSDQRNKLVGPSTVSTYLGILIDTENMQIRLPPEKLESLKNLLATWSSKVKCKKRELLSLIGKLSFACKVVKPGRMFLCRLIKLSTTVTSLDQYICIDEAAREDILLWVQFIWEWNGVSIILDNPNNRRLPLFTDNSNVGLGGILDQIVFCWHGQSPIQIFILI